MLTIHGVVYSIHSLIFFIHSYFLDDKLKIMKPDPLPWLSWQQTNCEAGILFKYRLGNQESRAVHHSDIIDPLRLLIFKTV